MLIDKLATMMSRLDPEQVERLVRVSLLLLLGIPAAYLLSYLAKRLARKRLTPQAGMILNKLVFASDESYFHTGEHKYGKWVDFHQRLFDRINVPEVLRRKVWCQTAAGLYRVKVG